ncbi:MAG: hypothetical protein QXQ64_07155 [Candidatus Bathyarchaeia archaeon]
MLSSKGDPPQQIASLAPWGSIKICGYNIPEQRSELIKITGYMAQRFSLYEDLSVFENLEFFGKFYGINGKELKIRILELLGHLYRLDYLPDLGRRGFQRGAIQHINLG